MKKENKARAKDKDFSVCPSCGSMEVKWLVGGQTGDQYKCSKCGYQGIALKGSRGFIEKLNKGWSYKKIAEKKQNRDECFG